MESLAQYLSIGIAVGIIYALLAVGFVLVFKASGVLNIAQGGLLMLGAYVCFTLVTRAGLPFWAAALLTLLFSFVLGLLIERFFIRPMIGEPVFSVIMMTVGLSVLIEGAAFTLWGPDPMRLPGMASANAVRFGPVALALPYVWGAVVSAFIFTLFALFYRYTRMGLAMRATAEDQTVALAKGINVKQVYGLSWAICSMVASVGGIFMAFIYGVGPALGPLGLKVIPVVIIGGLESIPGALVGGLIIGVSESLAAGYLDQHVGGGLKELFPYLLLLVVLMFRPYGLFGLKRIERI